MSGTDYIVALVGAFVLSLIFSLLIAWVARKLKILDQPDGKRKVHSKPIPLLGGVAIFLAFNLVMLFYAFVTKDLIGDTIILKNIVGLTIGSLLLIIGGTLDDKYNLKPKWQILWPVAAIVVVIGFGIGIDNITNLFAGGTADLSKYSFNLFWYNGFPYKITFLADIFTFIWLLAMMYTTKLLDGLDGLVSGITIVGAVFIFLTALNKGDIIQYDVALLAIILLGVFAGFLVLNFNPATIFLGEGGSTMAGFLLGAISIVSGSKVGITLMLLSIPVLDFIWTVIRRMMEKRPIFSSDRKHLHHRLLDSGFSVKQAVFFLYFIAIIFGIVAYYLQDLGFNLLTIGVGVVGVFMLILAYIYTRKKRLEKLLTERNK